MYTAEVGRRDPSCVLCNEHNAQEEPRDMELVYAILLGRCTPASPWEKRSEVDERERRCLRLEHSWPPEAREDRGAASRHFGVNVYMEATDTHGVDDMVHEHVWIALLSTKNCSISALASEVRASIEVAPGWSGDALIRNDGCVH